MRSNQSTSWPDGLTELFERLPSIPANEELELRVAVHDLQSYASHEPSDEHRHIDHAILGACSDMLINSTRHHDLPLTSKELESYRSKPYVRSINALVRTLLPQLDEPQAGLCLNGLQLQKCSFDHISLGSSSLCMADISYCKLSRADLSHADLRFANLMSATLAHSDLSGSLMESCDMSWCDFTHADLHRTQLMDSDLGGSILDHADISYAILSGANLANATLNHANLSYANLFGARLHLAKLYGCDLTGTGITPERLENAGMETHSDRGTIWGNETDCAGRNPFDPAYYAKQQSLL